MNAYSTIFSDAITQKSKSDKPCGYLDISATYFKRFISSYNSSEYGQVSLSFAHLYKAWDALYQSMLLLAGVPIRKRDPDDKYKLGRIVSITDSFINPIRDKKFSFKPELQGTGWKIARLQQIVDEVAEDRLAFESNKLFNSLDFLRELRNSSEHDFLEVGGGSYNALILKASPYIIPLANSYLDIYQEYQPIVLANCNEPTSKHNKGRAVTCAKPQVKRASSKELEQILHFPLPSSLLGTSIKEPNASVTALLKIIVKQFEKEERPLLVDIKWHVESVKEVMAEDYLNTTFPYRSISQIADKASVTRPQVEKVLKDNHLKTNQSFVLHLKSASGKTSILYSEKLLNLILRKKSQGEI